MEIEKKDIRALSKEELRDFFVNNGDKAFRGNQVYEWLWTKGAHSFEDMTNVSKATRAILEAHFVINHIKVDTMQRSEDGTVKNAVRLHDGLVVESVLIPTETRTAKRCVTNVRHMQISVIEVGVCHHRATEIGIAKIGSGQISVTKIGTFATFFFGQPHSVKFQHSSMS